MVNLHPQFSEGLKGNSVQIKFFNSKLACFHFFCSIPHGYVFMAVVSPQSGAKHMNRVPLQYASPGKLLGPTYCHCAPKYWAVLLAIKQKYNRVEPTNHKSARKNQEIHFCRNFIATRMEHKRQKNNLQTEKLFLKVGYWQWARPRAVRDVGLGILTFVICFTRSCSPCRFFAFRWLLMLARTKFCMCIIFYHNKILKVEYASSKRHDLKVWRTP